MYFLFFAAVVFGYDCTRDKDCKAVTVDKDFVQCLAGVCVRRTSQGFSGAANTTSKCQCSGGDIVYIDPTVVPPSVTREDLRRGSKSSDSAEIAYCIPVVKGLQCLEDRSREEIITGVVSQLYHSLVWPTPAIMMQQMITNQTHGGMWDLVDDNAFGRVDPAGEFTTKDGILEYFYGEVYLGVSQITNIWINKLFAHGNIVAVTVDMQFNWFDKFPNGTLLRVWNLTQSGFFTFNDKNQILSMDIIIHNVGWAQGAPDVDLPGLCNIILNVAHCDKTNDPNGYYKDIQDCIAFLQTVELGTYDIYRSNSIVCRQFHATLAIARPQVHCVHCGKTGIPYCVAHNYTDYYSQQY